MSIILSDPINIVYIVPRVCHLKNVKNIFGKNNAHFFFFESMNQITFMNIILKRRQTCYVKTYSGL